MADLFVIKQKLGGLLIENNSDLDAVISNNPRKSREKLGPNDFAILVPAKSNRCLVGRFKLEKFSINFLICR